MKLKVTVNGTAYDVEVEVEQEPPPTLGSLVFGAGARPASTPTVPTHAKAPAHEDKALLAPVSGTVTKVIVEEGQAVTAGTTLMLLEAMKMETEITAPNDGTVAEVAVKPGQAVAGGEVLLRWA